MDENSIRPEPAAESVIAPATSTIREQRFKTTVETSQGPQPFSGKCDLVILRQLDDDEVYRATIVDYKTISKIGHDLVRAHDEHIAQVNMYAWLVTKELPKSLWKPVIVDTVEIQYYAMEKARRFTSAGPLQARGKRIPRTKPWEYETLELAPIPLYPLALTEAAIKRRIEQRLEPELPLILPEEERWKCERCPVRELCYSKGDA
jgi:hypothetical protein